MSAKRWCSLRVLSRTDSITLSPKKPSGHAAWHASLTSARLVCRGAGAASEESTSASRCSSRAGARGSLSRQLPKSLDPSRPDCNSPSPVIRNLQRASHFALRDVHLKSVECSGQARQPRRVIFALAAPRRRISCLSCSVDAQRFGLQRLLATVLGSSVVLAIVWES